MQHCLSTFALASSGGLMLWSEKTTVCRIFSCQRSDGGSTPKPSARSLAGPDAPLRFLAESPLTVAVSESVNVGSIGALVLSSAWLAEAAPPHLTVQGRRNDSLNNLPDVGGRETQEASLAHRNSFKDQPAFTLSGFGAATFANIPERRLVENTGLEPVTSWLQTRRSPS